MRQSNDGIESRWSSLKQGDEEIWRDAAIVALRGRGTAENDSATMKSLASLKRDLGEI
jgi:hypothetical protein